MNDLATALSSVMVRDGQAAMTGTLNLGGNRLSNLHPGSVSSPSLFWTGNGINTGFYAPADDQIGVSIDGVQRLLIDLNGILPTGNLSLASAGVIQAIPRLVAEGTATLATRGKCSAGSNAQTIPANVFAAGDSYAIYNDSGAGISIVQGSGLTLRFAGTTSTGNRTLGARGHCCIWFNSTTEAVISGSGVT